ncbi:iron chelate uptake ABC transporter family permease subunit [Thermogymnomonas acidicola]|uniref:iron chelate uptake ABC transporter family permease subunit n=1 Tax=Thermogymnomonas acidicola TaxID=399579 RepID=UPI000946462E|nr:iron chelate uptake ABC transporter family permease subunit [Thermogymnomonas acidicola]
MRYVSLDSVALRGGATYIIPPLALVALSVLSLIIGSIRIPASTTFRIVGSQIPGISSYIHATWPRAYYIIVVYLREPEVIGSLVVGASLGVGGAVIQSVFRNPITEPYIIGISSGAALGAVIAFVSGITVFGIYSSRSWPSSSP